MTRQPSMPPFTVVQAALRRTTEHLARELHAPRTFAPQWNELEWSVARAVSSMQGIAVLLANRLRWHGPDSWQEFLATQRSFAMRRDARIGALLTAIDASMREKGLAAIGLKGTALRKLGLYRSGERPMGDIDLLVLPQDAERVARIMHGLDYALAFEVRRHTVYAPRGGAAKVNPGEHPDNPLKIEVHTKVAEALPVDEVGISAGWLDSGAPPGLLPYPTVRELMRHLLLHSAGNMRAHALRQIQLHDITRLATQLEPADWRWLLDTPESRGGAWWMLPPLALTERYYPGTFAAALLEEFAARCPPVLRHRARRTTLTQVSWSNLRIAAFPGVHWSRSLREALQFARSRIVPDRAALAELRIAAAAQPALEQISWYGIPHLHRLLRWTFARPPRVQTMMSLRAALAAGDESLSA
ncbi:MAG TPA: nucleotidyltransferase family protein [Steroidobacteraceae bacterium]|nr:nucleotidyltransferase family protein [Steroidobacteraceae bacterium]